MSRTETLELQDKLRNVDSDADSFDSYSNREIRIAIQGIILQDFYKSELYPEMFKQLSNIQIRETVIGFDLITFKNEITSRSVEYLNAFLFNFLKSNPDISKLVAKREINSFNFNATGAGASILSIAIRDLVYRYKDFEEFRYQLQHLLTHGLNSLAHQSANVVNEYEINKYLTIDSLAIKDRIIDYFTKHINPYDFLLASKYILNSYDPRDLSYDGIESINKFKNYLDLNASKYQKEFMNVTLKIVNFGSRYTAPTLSEEEIAKLDDTELEIFLALKNLPFSFITNIASYTSIISPEVEFFTTRYLSELKVLNSEYIGFNEENKIFIDVDKLLVTGVNRFSDLTFEKMYASGEPNTKIIGCPGLNERADLNLNTENKKSNFIDLIAHIIASQLKRNWHSIQAVGLI